MHDDERDRTAWTHVMPRNLDPRDLASGSSSEEPTQLAPPAPAPMPPPAPPRRVPWPLILAAACVVATAIAWISVKPRVEPAPLVAVTPPASEVELDAPLPRAEKGSEATDRRREALDPTRTAPVEPKLEPTRTAPVEPKLEPSRTARADSTRAQPIEPKLEPSRTARSDSARAQPIEPKLDPPPPARRDDAIDRALAAARAQPQRAELIEALQDAIELAASGLAEPHQTKVKRCADSAGRVNDVVALAECVARLREARGAR